MAILLGAFLIHGLVPGPDMLTKHLDITYSMVWSIAVANIVGSGLCFLFSGQLAKLATLRYTLIMPIVLSLIYIGAFEASRNWGDLYSLLFFGMLGWAMKHFRWPRPPLILGIVLGGILERYMFISIERYGVSWMLRPLVIVMFAMSVLTLTRPMLQDIREHHGIKAMLSNFGMPRLTTDNLFPAALIAIFVVHAAAIVPVELRGQDHPDHRGRDRAHHLQREPGERHFQQAARGGRGRARRQGEGGGQRRRSTWTSRPRPATCRGTSS